MREVRLFRHKPAPNPGLRDNLRGPGIGQNSGGLGARARRLVCLSDPLQSGSGGKPPVSAPADLRRRAASRFTPLMREGYPHLPTRNWRRIGRKRTYDRRRQGSEMGGDFRATTRAVIYSILFVRALLGQSPPADHHTPICQRTQWRRTSRKVIAVTGRQSLVLQPFRATPTIHRASTVPETATQRPIV